jgi:hypothetical protein
MKSTNRKGAMVAEANAEFLLNQALISLRFSPRTLHLCTSFYLLPKHNSPRHACSSFLLGLADGIRAEVRKSSLIQSIKIHLPEPHDRKKSPLT